MFGVLLLGVWDFLGKRRLDGLQWFAHFSRQVSSTSVLSFLLFFPLEPILTKELSQLLSRLKNMHKYASFTQSISKINTQSPLSAIPISRTTLQMSSLSSRQSSFNPSICQDLLKPRNKKT